MASAAQSPHRVPAVSTVETPMQQRLRAVPQQAYPPDPRFQDHRATTPSTHAAGELAAKMRLVKAARFNAAARLENKQTASLFTQSMVALYFVGLSVWQAVYVNQIDEPTQRLVTFLSIVSSVFTLILGLLEALNDWQMKAHHLQNCGLAVSELAQELSIASPAHPADVQDFRRRYNEALRACPVNHTRLDYQFAKLEGTQDRAAWALLCMRYGLNVYGIYAIFLVVPPLLWWMHR